MNQYDSTGMPNDEINSVLNQESILPRNRDSKSNNSMDLDTPKDDGIPLQS
jgi:hypothetical protein